MGPGVLAVLALAALAHQPPAEPPGRLVAATPSPTTRVFPEPPRAPITRVTPTFPPPTRHLIPTPPPPVPAPTPTFRTATRQPTHTQPTPIPVPIPIPPPTHRTPTPTFSVPPPSPGVRFVSVPRLVGFSLQTAESMLARAGLEVGSVSEQPSSAFAGTVVRTDPPAYTAVQPGSSVDLVVAAG